MLWHSKVANLDVPLTGKQDIVKFDISMQHILRVTILKRSDDLRKNEAGHVFFQPAASAHVSQELAATTYLHHEDYVLLSLEWLVKADNVLVAEASKDDELLHYLLLGRLLRQELLVDGFESHKLLR